MPIKKPNARANIKKAQKQAKNSKNIFLISGIVLAVVIVSVYVFFRGPSDTILKDSSKNTEASDSINKQGLPSILPQDVQTVVSKARLQLESVDNKDILKVIVEKAVGANSKEVTYKYEWTLNGQPAGDGSDSISGFKRGDQIAVKITPFDGETVAGQSRVLSMEIANTTPKIIEQKESPFDGKTFTTQIKASDPDGDPLSYELLSGPQGMIIDSKSGTVNWPVKDNDAGDHTIKVKISDGHGGEVMYQLTATIPKDIPQPATVPKKTP